MWDVKCKKYWHALFERIRSLEKINSTL